MKPDMTWPCFQCGATEACSCDPSMRIPSQKIEPHDDSGSVWRWWRQIADSAHEQLSSHLNSAASSQGNPNKGIQHNANLRIASSRDTRRP
jgi:hypothetical protein